jgi:hypothetical protein
MILDFTLDKYADLCDTILELPCHVMTVAQFLRAKQPLRPILMLRHDVDRSLGSALRMAELEAERNIRSTYYVRKIRNVFRPDVLTHLCQLGHEVGYHYEVLTKARGDHQRAITLFECELEQFRQIVPVDTISMHGSPMLPWDNRELWRIYDFADYDLLGEVYLSIDYQHVYYFTDTGRSWEAGRDNLRDRVTSRPMTKSIRTTTDLIAFLRSAPACPILINAHPNRWTANQWAWIVGTTSDWVMNQAKRVIAWQRSTFSRIGK